MRPVRDHTSPTAHLWFDLGFRRRYSLRSKTSLPNIMRSLQDWRRPRCPVSVARHGIASDGVVWLALASGHAASFDGRLCKGR